METSRPPLSKANQFGANRARSTPVDKPIATVTVTLAR
jgi:hypothetical protein